jgi:hypothetical protein
LRRMVICIIHVIQRHNNVNMIFHGI